MKKLLIIFTIVFSTNAFALIDDDIVGGCDVITLNAVNNLTNMLPVYRAKNYTCNTGYFLPANTEGCQPCPSGYICDGGSFDFNEYYAQGINLPTYITQNASNICSVNLLNSVGQTTNMIPIFRPKTMTLNFDDGNGNVTSTTCTYGDTITIPDTVPTRPGYTFTGWVVRQTEQSNNN